MKWPSTTAPRDRALPRAQPPTPTRWKTPPATRPTRASTTTSTPTANSSRCGRSPSRWKKLRRRSRCSTFPAASQRDGIENQASLRAAINAAVRANLAIYSVDTRGLQAISPLGDASTGSLRGTGAYNGRRAHQQHERQLRHAGSDGDALAPIPAARLSSIPMILLRPLRRCSAIPRPTTPSAFAAPIPRATARIAS